MSHLGILTEHVEPEDGRPGTILLARVGDNDNWEGGGLEEKQLLLSSYSIFKLTTD